MLGVTPSNRQALTEAYLECIEMLFRTVASLAPTLTTLYLFFSSFLLGSVFTRHLSILSIEIFANNAWSFTTYPTSILLAQHLDLPSNLPSPCGLPY